MDQQRIPPDHKRIISQRSSIIDSDPGLLFGEGHAVSPLDGALDRLKVAQSFRTHRAVAPPTAPV